MHPPGVIRNNPLLSESVEKFKVDANIGGNRFHSRVDEGNDHHTSMRRLRVRHLKSRLLERPEVLCVRKNV